MRRVFTVQQHGDEVPRLHASPAASSGPAGPSERYRPQSPGHQLIGHSQGNILLAPPTYPTSTGVLALGASGEQRRAGEEVEG